MDRNSSQCATPASITKVISTATALELLGPDYTYKTTIEHDGTITDGVLHGNLYIRGGGDPTLGSYYLGNPGVIKQWARELRGMGIRAIQGDIIPDASCFDKEPIPIHWSWEDMGNYYAAGTFGLSIFDNSLRLTFKSGASGTTPQLVSVSPQIAGLHIDNQLTTLKIAADSGYIYGMPYDNKRIVLGGIPANRELYTLRGDIPNPPMLVAQRLDSALKEVGITVNGECKERFNSSNPRNTILIHESPKLREIIKLTNFRSNNLYAEHLFKSTALTKYGQASNAKAIEVIKQYWSSKGIDVSSLFLKDGSGLSPQNAFSAKTLNEILAYMYQKSPNKEVFIASLPRAGKEGTVAGFMAKTPLEGKVWMKSGSITGVQCYSGYILDNDKEYAFTIMVNNWVGARKDVRAQIRQWLLEAAGYN